MDNTKGLKRRLDITTRDFKRKVTYEHRTDGQVGSSDWNIPKEEGRTLEEVVPVFCGLACNTYATISQELHSAHFIRIKGSQQLWCNLCYPRRPVDFFWKVEYHTLFKCHLCKTKNKYQ